MNSISLQIFAFSANQQMALILWMQLIFPAFKYCNFFCLNQQNFWFLLEQTFKNNFEACNACAFVYRRRQLQPAQNPHQLRATDVLSSGDLDTDSHQCVIHSGSVLWISSCLWRETFLSHSVAWAHRLSLGQPSGRAINISFFLKSVWEQIWKCSGFRCKHSLRFSKQRWSWKFFALMSAWFASGLAHYNCGKLRRCSTVPEMSD